MPSFVNITNKNNIKIYKNENKQYNFIELKQKEASTKTATPPLFSEKLSEIRVE